MSTPDNHIKEVWSSPTVHNIVFKRPADDQRRYGELNVQTAKLIAELPPYTGHASLSSSGFRSSTRRRRSHRPDRVACGQVLLQCIRRPRRSRFLLTLAGAAFVAAAGSLRPCVGVDGRRIVVPFVPSFVLLTTAGIFGLRQGNQAHRHEARACRRGWALRLMRSRRTWTFTWPRVSTSSWWKLTRQ